MSDSLTNLSFTSEGDVSVLDSFVKSKKYTPFNFVSEDFSIPKKNLESIIAFLEDSLFSKFRWLKRADW